MSWTAGASLADRRDRKDERKHGSQDNAECEDKPPTWHGEDHGTEPQLGHSDHLSGGGPVNNAAGRATGIPMMNIAPTIATSLGRGVRHH